MSENRATPHVDTGARPHVDPPANSRAELVRGLGVWDGVLLTVGSVIGTGIFLVSSDIAKVLPHGGMLLLVWLAGGLLSLTGALTYAELGAMFPRAGGIYVFLKEAYGPLTGFLYGWGCFLVMMSGGMAAIAIGFGEYSGAFFPFASTTNVLASQSFGAWTWTLSGVQVVAVAAILFLTAVNHFGLKQGAAVQNLMTVLKIGAIVAVAVLGFWVPAKSALGITAPLATAMSGGGLLAAFGLAMIAALWTYDGWYGLTFSAGEMKNPGRSLPLGLIGGTAIITALYLLINFVYLRAMPVERMAGESRIGEAAATALLGPLAGQWLAAAVVVSTFGCLAATILYSSRIYHPMAEDGLFFRSLARIDPVTHVPARSLWAQSLWAVVLTLSGSYSQLYTYAVLVTVLFHVMAGAAVFVLRRTRPEAPRPYRVWGYPYVPIAFLAAMAVLLVNTVVERPVESLLGLGLVALGLPAYVWLRRSSPRRD
ncbi:MAG: amino acid permease [Thermoanaerobaculia bacterium]|nr:amino acid permease [Thermoanaerobaculia bacterium]MBP9824928.1 amino acid permease [Thermoanaerobaculia bacterium]